MAGNINAINGNPSSIFVFILFHSSSDTSEIIYKIRVFIWNYKAVRLSKKHLCKPKAEGGFSLPSFRNYYWAANLQFLSWWRQIPENKVEIPEWVWLERTSCRMTSLEALLNNTIKIESRFYNENIVINNCLKIWKQIQSFLDLPNIYLDSPICKNHAFTPGLQNKVFSQWKQKSLISIRDLQVHLNKLECCGKVISFISVI